MERITLTTKVGANGMLEVSVPVGQTNADRPVVITVEPIAAPSREAWENGILKTAGKWMGDFERPSQGDYEQREALS